MKLQKDRAPIVGLIAFFLLLGLLLSLFRPSAELPLDSRSNRPDGLRVLYLTLEELGFSVGRKTGPIDKTGVGVVLVFGPEYLAGENPDAIDAWEDAGGVYFEMQEAEWYVNGGIDAGGVLRLAYELWPYRDMTVWFDEYGRGIAPASTADAAPTPTSILPVWVLALLWQAGLLILLALLLYGGRLGPPVRTERGRRRDERDDAQALANLMERSRLLPDALRLCYGRLVEITRSSWPQLERACECPPAEPERALALVEEMERLARSADFGASDQVEKNSA